MRTSFAALAVSLCVRSAVAGPFEDAIAAHQSGDYTAALALLRPLADQDNAKAQFDLGYMYLEGQGVPQDNAIAVKLVRKAAEQGYAKAEMYLGTMYEGGREVAPGDVAAATWYRKAADQGNRSAQFSFREMYFAGRGVPRNLVHAHVWFNLAFEESDYAAQRRDWVAKEMTPDQIEEAQKIAREWKPSLAPK